MPRAHSRLGCGAHLDYATRYDNNGKELLCGRQTVQAIEQPVATWAYLNKAADDETRAMVHKTHAHIFVHLDRPAMIRSSIGSLKHRLRVQPEGW